MTPDATLNYWADVFVARKVARQGIDLEQFLRDPHAVLRRLDRLAAAGNGGVDHRPVRAIREDLRARRRGNVAIVKLWHGSRKRNRADLPLTTRR
jgi:hypothetical protein